MKLYELRRFIKQLFCKHEFQMSKLVALNTGKRLGGICVKCGKYTPAQEQGGKE